MEINEREVTKYEYDLQNIEDVQLLHHAINYYADYLRKRSEENNPVDIQKLTEKNYQQLLEWSETIYKFLGRD